MYVDTYTLSTLIDDPPRDLTPPIGCGSG